MACSFHLSLMCRVLVCVRHVNVCFPTHHIGMGRLVAYFALGLPFTARFTFSSSPVSGVTFLHFLLFTYTTDLSFVSEIIKCGRLGGGGVMGEELRGVRVVRGMGEVRRGLPGHI